jgi:hypothetical protein
MKMKGRVWLPFLTVLVLMASGCEPKPNEAPPPPTTAEQEELTLDKPASPDVTEEAVATEESAPAEPTVSEVVEPAPAEGEKAVPEAAGQSPVAEMTTPALAESVKPSSAAKPAVAVSPQTVIYDPPFGRVAFNHQAHAGSFDCVSCHSTDPPGKIVLGKDKAHELCRGCHQQMAAGPAQCSGCHKKN